MELQAVSYRHPDGLEISVQSERPLLYLQVVIISETCFYLCVPILFMVLVTDILMCKKILGLLPSERIIVPLSFSSKKAVYLDSKILCGL